MKERIPDPPRAAVRALRRRIGTATASQRLRPSYIIIGAQKGGTSSLQIYLDQHPGVSTPPTKEIHYFNRNHERSWEWYLGHFPTRRSAAAGAITGEATPEYLVHPLVPARVAARLPEVKLIAVLRDPVTRALSHYNHERAHDREPLSFDEALRAERSRLDGEMDRVLREPGYYSDALRNQSYVHRGMYAEQLERWLEHFSRDQLLVLQSEVLFEQPDAVYQRVLSFLGLPPHHPGDFKAHNARRYRGLDPEIGRRLSETFAEPNERLFALIGERFDWLSPQTAEAA